MARRDSISNYPEHLNPFYEVKEKHKFWKFGTLKRRGSFSETLRNTLTLKSFRKKKDKPEKCPSPLQLRRPIPASPTVTTHRQTLPTTLSPIYSPRNSVEPPSLPRSRFSERVSSPALRKEEAHLESFKKGVISGNPFEDGEISASLPRRMRRKKKRAPLPPNTVREDGDQHLSVSSRYNLSKWSLTSMDTDISTFTEEESSHTEMPQNRIAEIMNITKEMNKMTDETDTSRATPTIEISESDNGKESETDIVNSRSTNFDESLKTEVRSENIPNENCNETLQITTEEEESTALAKDADNEKENQVEQVDINSIESEKLDNDISEEDNSDKTEDTSEVDIKSVNTSHINELSSMPDRTVSAAEQLQEKLSNGHIISDNEETAVDKENNTEETEFKQKTEDIDENSNLLQTNTECSPGIKTDDSSLAEPLDLNFNERKSIDNVNKCDSTSNSCKTELSLAINSTAPKNSDSPIPKIRANKLTKRNLLGNNGIENT